LPENNLFIPVRCGEQLMSQRDIEFSTGANQDCAARAVNKRKAAEDCDPQWYICKRRRERG